MQYCCEHLYIVKNTPPSFSLCIFSHFMHFDLLVYAFMDAFIYIMNFHKPTTQLANNQLWYSCLSINKPANKYDLPYFNPLYCPFYSSVPRELRALLFENLLGKLVTNSTLINSHNLLENLFFSSSICTPGSSPCSMAGQKAFFSGKYTGD